MLRQKLPTRLVLCQRNPRSHFEHFQTIILRCGSFSSVLNRLAEPKFGRKRGARRGLRVVIHGLCCFRMSSNLSRPVVAASRPSGRSRFVGVAGLAACGVARGGEKISIRSVCDGWRRLFLPKAFRCRVFFPVNQDCTCLGTDSVAFSSCICSHTF